MIYSKMEFGVQQYCCTRCNTACMHEEIVSGVIIRVLYGMSERLFAADSSVRMARAGLVLSMFAHYFKRKLKHSIYSGLGWSRTRVVLLFLLSQYLVVHVQGYSFVSICLSQVGCCGYHTEQVSLSLTNFTFIHPCDDEHAILYYCTCVSLTNTARWAINFVVGK